ncbi:hypothetical protein [Metapseudomonas boanensis]|uniref:DUF2314 domain-containing protein n=1 Tax=Metapseudomonas boanensis TaxID=2822138 RepID=A0ABS5XN85_9GAMM|nr:hypothetical protein [Pseudomonas boanensis]MBT8769166.1 hypothetical protein [Pseudomonas boanensis]
MDAKLADIETDGWELDDGEARHNEHPETFWIPHIEVRNNLQPEQIVKLIFRIVTIDNSNEEEVNVERMWVIVKGRIGGLYRGQLDNDPYCTDDIKAGMEVWFLSKHVIDISDE